jgi:hypothetical protein
MRVRFGRCVLGASLILIAGCVGPQSTGALGAIPGGGRLSMRSHPSDLLYYSGSASGRGVTYILSFPQGKLVGSFNGNGQLCPDTAGNVWVAGYPSGYTNALIEFAHGGEVPIKILRVTQTKQVFDCAVDPTTGDLAAVGSKRHVFIFKGASAPAKALRDHYDTGSCIYDSSGNLFVQGFHRDGSGVIEISELAKGSTKFRTVRSHVGLYATTGLRWDGKHLTVGEGFNEGGHDLYRYSVLGTHLKSRHEVSFDGHFDSVSGYWIQGSKAVAATWCVPHSACKPIYLYNYPAGGNPIETIGDDVVPFLSQASVAVSP